LPIVPPTCERVAAFLSFTDRDPQEVLGVLRPEQRGATIWSVAVNGVMAGCRSEYMPILIAAVEAIADPEFRIQDAGATPAWEPMVIVNGPIVDELDFNSGTGALRVGCQANSSVGRFLRLYMRNVAGLRFAPGETDKGAIGFTFNVALAEDYGARRELNWQPFNAARGFGPDDNVVTVQSITAASPPIYSDGTTGRQHMQRIAEVFSGTAAYWSSLGMRSGRWHPLLVMGPAVARELARDGWDEAERPAVPARDSHDSGRPGGDLCPLDRQHRFRPACQCPRGHPAAGARLVGRSRAPGAGLHPTGVDRHRGRRRSGQRAIEGVRQQPSPRATDQSADRPPTPVGQPAPPPAAFTMRE
jgi:hypothetical protein